MWRPDEGWGERDAFIVANAKLGTSTPTHYIYEHLDVMVHPLGVHLTETMGRNFWVRPAFRVILTLRQDFGGMCALGKTGCFVETILRIYKTLSGS